MTAVSVGFRRQPHRHHHRLERFEVCWTRHRPHSLACRHAGFTTQRLGLCFAQRRLPVASAARLSAGLAVDQYWQNCCHQSLLTIRLRASLSVQRRTRCVHSRGLFVDQRRKANNGGRLTQPAADAHGRRLFRLHRPRGPCERLMLTVRRAIAITDGVTVNV